MLGGLSPHDPLPCPENGSGGEAIPVQTTILTDPQRPDCAKSVSTGGQLLRVDPGLSPEPGAWASYCCALHPKERFRHEEPAWQSPPKQSLLALAAAEQKLGSRLPAADWRPSPRLGAGPTVIIFSPARRLAFPTQWLTP